MLSLLLLYLVNMSKNLQIFECEVFVDAIIDFIIEKEDNIVQNFLEFKGHYLFLQGAYRNEKSFHAGNPGPNVVS